MKFKEFVSRLSMYFGPDDEIYPHSSGSIVIFYRIYHGQGICGIEQEAGSYDRPTLSVHPSCDHLDTTKKSEV